MGYYTIREITPWLYSLADGTDRQVVFCYLLVGAERALLYDTAYGIGNLTEAVRTVTDKPFTVVLGHGHVDHANGAHQFDEVWLREGDFALFQEHTSAMYRRTFWDSLPTPPAGYLRETYLNACAGCPRALPDGHVFDLGSLRVETVAMEGHTAGSAGLLVPEKKTLLTSDAANAQIWMFLNELLPIRDYVAMLKRTLTLDFDTFFVGHADAPLPKTEIPRYIRAAENASPDKAAPYPLFPELRPMLYQEDGAGIVFNERTWRG